MDDFSFEERARLRNGIPVCQNYNDRALLARRSISPDTDVGSLEKQADHRAGTKLEGLTLSKDDRTDLVGMEVIANEDWGSKADRSVEQMTREGGQSWVDLY